MRNAGKDNSAADALSRFSIRARGLDPYPDRELRWRFRKEAQRCCGAVDVDMLASDDGRNAWVPDFRPPSNSAFEGPLPPGRFRRFPRIEMVRMVLARIAAYMREEWRGTHLVLAPLAPWKHWLPKLARFERVLVWNAGTQLFADCRSGKRLWVPMVEDARWAVSRIAMDA